MGTYPWLQQTFPSISLSIFMSQGLLFSLEFLFSFGHKFLQLYSNFILCVSKLMEIIILALKAILKKEKHAAADRKLLLLRSSRDHRILLQVVRLKENRNERKKLRD